MSAAAGSVSVLAVSSSSFFTSVVEISVLALALALAFAPTTSVSASAPLLAPSILRLARFSFSFSLSFSAADVAVAVVGLPGFELEDPPLSEPTPSNNTFSSKLSPVAGLVLSSLLSLGRFEAVKLIIWNFSRVDNVGDDGDRGLPRGVPMVESLLRDRRTLNPQPPPPPPPPSFVPLLLVLLWLPDRPQPCLRFWSAHDVQLPM